MLLIFGGVMMTLSSGLAPILGGMTVITFAFYGAHSIASSWVGVQAHEAKAQAASLYLFAYYTGSSVFGSLGGLAWQWKAWPGVVMMSCVLLACALLGAVVLARVPRPAPR